jgi:AcrR family transcriptional regulator
LKHKSHTIAKEGWRAPNQHTLKKMRPRRGSPEQTRDRLVAAAAQMFNAMGYHGTDSNQIAKAAGYSAGTFYKHFKDKRAIFLAVYESWVVKEWEAVAAECASERSVEAVAAKLVSLGIEFHTRWRKLRASLLELVVSDSQVRTFYRMQRRRQLDLMVALRAQVGSRSRHREEDAIHLFTAERTFDAIAQGEAKELELDLDVLREEMTKRIVALLT